MNISHPDPITPIGATTAVGKLSRSSALMPASTASLLGDPGSQVAISPSGLAASRQITRPEGLRKVLDEARADPDFGQRYLGQLAGVTTDGPLLDISHPPDIRLSSTGELWTDEKQARYAALSSHVMQQRRDLIDNGLAAGRAPADVLEQLYAFNDTLPQWYKDGMNWQ